MQIQPFSAAAQAAGAAAQASSKDKASHGGQAAPNAASVSATELHVEKSGAADPDRDAQGQGDGLPGHRQEDTRESDEHSTPKDSPAALLPGEEPGQLDIIG